MDKVKTIKNYLQNQKKEWRMCKSSEAKYRMEVYDELLDVIDSLLEEPVSEDLEGASNNYAKSEEKRVGCGTEFFTPELAKAFKAGAKWLRIYFENNRLNAFKNQTEEEAQIEMDFAVSIIEKEHRTPTFDDAIKYGMMLQKMKANQDELPKWRYKKDNTPLLRDSIILNKYGCVAKSPSGALVSDVWVIGYDELAKLPKEE